MEYWYSKWTATAKQAFDRASDVGKAAGQWSCPLTSI